VGVVVAQAAHHGVDLHEQHERGALGHRVDAHLGAGLGEDERGHEYGHGHGFAPAARAHDGDLRVEFGKVVLLKDADEVPLQVVLVDLRDARRDERLVEHDLVVGPPEAHLVEADQAAPEVLELLVAVDPAHPPGHLLGVVFVALKQRRVDGPPPLLLLPGLLFEEVGYYIGVVVLEHLAAAAAAMSRGRRRRRRRLLDGIRSIMVSDPLILFLFGLGGRLLVSTGSISYYSPR